MRAVVTGGTGFLGGTLARRLAGDGIDVLALGRDAEKGAALEASGITFVRAEITDIVALRSAFSGADVVFHTAALSTPWGRYADFHEANVVGTEAVAKACLAGSVGRVVHVSTPSIYFANRDRLDVREDAPLPRRQINAYSATKLAGEAVVDEACGRGLSVITIRPRAIFGPGDNAILPRLVSALERGRLPIVGRGDNVTDLTYVDNVVDAMLLAAEAPEALVGRKYNVTNGEPVLLWEMVGRVCDELGLERPTRRISYPLVLAAAVALEGVHRVLMPDVEPLLTRYTAGVLAKSTTLDITAARRDLGYKPRVSVGEGLSRFVAWWKQRPR